MKCPIPLSEWPNWAQWAAMDENESWYFYESKPEIYHDDNSWCNCNNKNIQKSIYKGSNFNWHKTITNRSEIKG